MNSENLDDVGLLLVGPGNQQSFLLSDAGGDNPATGLSLTFDDEAVAPPPDATVFGSGSYQPFNYDAVETFPAPAPVISGSTVLSVFDGLSPNGHWRLFADDDNSDDLTVITKWSLDFSWVDTQSPTGTVSVNAGAAAAASQAVTLNLTATDPAPASGVAQMRFSNDGVTFSAYQPFAATAAWSLAAGVGEDGLRTVQAQRRQRVGGRERHHHPGPAGHDRAVVDQDEAGPTRPRTSR